MSEDLLASWQELGNMLADVEQNYGDMHPDDVIGILDNCTLKATELAQQIVARREYVRELAPYWKITSSGADAGMPSARQLPMTGNGKDIS